jgi:glycerol-3-phosphate dehydrogenase (NAD(P)+)
MKITFLGAGNMGTALAFAASEKADNKITLWSIEEDVVKDINTNHKNTKYVGDITLNSNITATGDIKTALKNAEIVVFSVPTHIVRIVAKQAKGLIPENAVIVDVAKGLEKDTNKRMSEVLNEYFNNTIVAVGGPCIANELIKKVPTFVVYASKNKKALRKCKENLETNYYNISASSDIIGVELMGGLKNIIAILCGVSDGLGYGVNTKAGLISKGLEELKLVGEKMGADSNSVYSLAGLGDLVVTCSSKHSRNRRFGEALAKGMGKEDAKNSIGQVVEGEKAVLIVKKIIDEHKLNCPLISKVHNIVVLGEKPSLSI